MTSSMDRRIGAYSIDLTSPGKLSCQIKKMNFIKTSWQAYTTTSSKDSWTGDYSIDPTSPGKLSCQIKKKKKKNFQEFVANTYSNFFHGEIYRGLFYWSNLSGETLLSN
jgi:hypothetical protein